MNLQDQLKKMNVTLPVAPKASGSYLSLRKSGNLVFLSGVLPRDEKGVRYTGKVGRDLDVKQAQVAARCCALNVLSVIDAQLGLDQVKQFVRITGFVQSDPAFVEQHLVMNGASDFLVEVFGEKGKHARSAVGVASLPLNAAVEIEVTLEMV
jgi:enamine deaminase RidA (YjgF/YER057c/UK114 family)